ncbi:MAG: VOC family protein [Oscillospiraceae bacterium]
MSNYLFKGLAHIGILTDNPQKCADFYCKNLGFRPYHVANMGSFQLVFVENGGMVIEFVGIGANTAGGTIDHIAIEVQNIEALVADLKAKGVKVDGLVGSVPPMFPNGFKSILLTGPAGENIELVDFSK